MPVCRVSSGPLLVVPLFLPIFGSGAPQHVGQSSWLVCGVLSFPFQSVSPQLIVCLHALRRRAARFPVIERSKRLSKRRSAGTCTAAQVTT